MTPLKASRLILALAISSNAAAQLRATVSRPMSAPAFAGLQNLLASPAGASLLAGNPQLDPLRRIVSMSPSSPGTLQALGALAANLPADFPARIEAARTAGPAPPLAEALCRAYAASIPDALAEIDARSLAAAKSAAADANAWRRLGSAASDLEPYSLYGEAARARVALFAQRAAAARSQELAEGLARELLTALRGPEPAAGGREEAIDPNSFARRHARLAKPGPRVPKGPPAADSRSSSGDAAPAPVSEAARAAVSFLSLIDAKSEAVGDIAKALGPGHAAEILDLYGAGIEDDDWIVRRSAARSLDGAAQALGPGHAGKILELYERGIESGDANVRAGTAEALSGVAQALDPGHAGALLEFYRAGIEDPDGGVRSGAAQALAGVAKALDSGHAEEILELYRAGIRNPDKNVRSGTAKSLAGVAQALGPAHANAILTLAGAGIEDADEIVRRGTVESLAGVAAALGPAHAGAIWTLTKAGTKGVDRYATEAFADVAQALGPAYAEEILELARARLKNADEGARRDAWESLARISRALGPSYAGKILELYLAETKDRDSLSRSLAGMAQVLGPRHAEEVLRSARAAVEDGDWAARRNTAQSLAGLAQALGPGHAEELLELYRAGIQDTEANVRAAAAQSLAGLARFGAGHAEAVLTLAEAGSKNPDRNVRSGTAQSLADLAQALGPSYAKEILGLARAGSADRDKAVRVAAAQSLAGVAQALGPGYAREILELAGTGARDRRAAVRIAAARALPGIAKIVDLAGVAAVSERLDAEYPDVDKFFAWKMLSRILGSGRDASLLFSTFLPAWRRFESQSPAARAAADVLLRHPAAAAAMEVLDPGKAELYFMRSFGSRGAAGLRNDLGEIERWLDRAADFPGLDIDAVTDLARLLPLDAYALEIPDRAAMTVYRQRRQDRELFKIRALLADGRFDDLRRLAKGRGIEPDRIVKAAALNRQNDIVSQTADLIVAHAGTRGVLPGMVALREKIGKKSFTRRELETIAEAAGAPAGGIEDAVKRAGYRFYKSGEETLVIPMVFDVLLSAYRGSAEHDNAEANYLTHAPTTAIVHYADKGGESRSGDSAPYGANAFHEFDLGLLMLIGRTNRTVDDHVSLAFSYNGDPLPEYARKRTRILEETTAADHLETLSRQQEAERRAKQDILKIFRWIGKGALTSAGLARAENLLEDRLQTLRARCGLKDGYYEAVFGSLDDAFFRRLRRKYAPGRDDAAALRGVLRDALQGRTAVEAAARKGAPARLTAHPWLKAGKTLWDYLEQEAEIRKGTFDDVDLSALTLDDLEPVPKAP